MKSENFVFFNMVNEKNYYKVTFMKPSFVVFVKTLRG